MENKLQKFFGGKRLNESVFNGIYVLFLIALGIRFLTQLFADFGYDSWFISEFLINYQGGFVRRGLLGEILFFFTQHSGIDVEWTIKIISVLFLAFLTTFFVRSFIKKGYTLYILPLCFFLGAVFYANSADLYTTNSWIKKDCMMVSILIFSLYACRSKMPVLCKVLLVNVMGIFVILTHELYAFFALPVLFLLFVNIYNRGQLVRAGLYAAASLLPSVIAFGLACLAHGDRATADAIWDSWQVLAGNSPARPIGEDNAIVAIGWDSVQTFRMHLEYNFLKTHYGLWSLPVWLLTFPLVYYIVTNAISVFRKETTDYDDSSKTTLSAILLFQLFCMIPAFTVLCCDYGRLFFFWITSSFAIFLIIPGDIASKLFPPFAYRWAAAVNIMLVRIITPGRTAMAILMMVIGISSVSFSVINMINTTMVYQILNLPIATAKLFIRLFM